MTGLSARIWLMLLLWVIICQSGVFADSFTGKCIEVVDGDTIVVVCDGKEKKIRIEGIDCPEKGQDFYDEAKQLTSDLVLNEDVWVNVRKIDSYGRSVSCVEVCNKDLRVELLNAGLAMHYTKHNKEKLLEQTENEANSYGYKSCRICKP